MMLLVKSATMFVVHFILVLSVDVWTTGHHTQCTSVLWWIRPFLGNSFLELWWFITLFGGKRFTGSKDTSRFISQLGNKLHPASVTLPISLFHMHLICLHSKHDKQAMDMIPTRKNYILIKCYHSPTEAAKRLPVVSIQIEMNSQKPLLPCIQAQQTMKRGICNWDAEFKELTVYLKI